MGLLVQRGSFYWKGQALRATFRGRRLPVRLSQRLPFIVQAASPQEVSVAGGTAESSSVTSTTGQAGEPGGSPGETGTLVGQGARAEAAGVGASFRAQVGSDSGDVAKVRVQGEPRIVCEVPHVFDAATQTGGFVDEGSDGPSQGAVGKALLDQVDISCVFSATPDGGGADQAGGGCLQEPGSAPGTV